MNQVLRAAIYQYRCREEAPLDRLSRLDQVLEAHDGEVDLVICPELFLSGYNVGDQVRHLAEPQAGPFAKAAAALAKKRRTALIYGYPEQAGGGVYNAAMCIGADGVVLAHHRKLRLPNAFEQSHFSPGDAYTFFQLNGWKVAILVCYDIEFPEAVRRCAQQGAQLVVAPTALRKQWSFVARHMVPTRAFENGIFVAYANYCGTEGDFEYLGESRFIGPTGHLVSAADQETLVTAALDRQEIALARRDLPYLQDCTFLERIR
jgi:predicted amidohydrolase